MGLYVPDNSSMSKPICQHYRSQDEGSRSLLNGSEIAGDVPRLKDPAQKGIIKSIC